MKTVFFYFIFFNPKTLVAEVSEGKTTGSSSSPEVPSAISLTHSHTDGSFDVHAVPSDTPLLWYLGGGGGAERRSSARRVAARMS